MASWKMQRFAREDETWPGTGETRQQNGIDSVFLINRDGGSNDRRIGGRACGIVAAAHVDLDIAEAFFDEVGFECGERSCCRHVGDETHVDFCDGFARQNGFTAW